MSADIFQDYTVEPARQSHKTVGDTLPAETEGNSRPFPQMAQVSVQEHIHEIFLMRHT